MNQEVKALVADNKGLKQRHADVEGELQLAYKTIKQLERENGDLKADLEEALHNQKPFQEDPVSRAPVKESVIQAPIPVPAITTSNMNDQMDDDPHSNMQNDNKNDREWNHDRVQARMSVMVNPGSAVHTGSVDNFRNAIDDLLQAGR